jgi:DNA-binding winged helix-turn-helix (wHTH) protein
MRIAIIGGNSEDERHLGRLVEKVGQTPVFVRLRSNVGMPNGQRSNEPLPASTLEHVLERLEREALDEQGQSRTPEPLRAFVFEAIDRAEAAIRVLSAVRRDPYFDRVGTLLILHAEQAGTLNLPGGFDDFVLYPCGVDELFIRARALAQRRAPFGAGSFADDTGVVVDETSRDVIVDGHAVQLTAREFALFTYLCEWRGKVLSREHLLARVWGSRYSGGRRTVDIHVRRLRAKLGASLAIETLRGSGYRLRREPPSAQPTSLELPKPFRAELPAPYPSQRTQPFSAQIPEPFSKVS